MTIATHRRRPGPKGLLLLLAGVVLAAGASTIAQGGGASFTAGPVYTSIGAGSGPTGAPRYPEVEIVLRDRDSQIPKHADLRLTEPDGTTDTATAVRRFDELGYGIEAVTAIDASGSMRGAPLAILRDSLYRFVSQARPQDRLGVVSFADDLRWEARPDVDRDQLRSSLQKLTSRGHLTRIFDGLLETLDSFEGNLERRELVVISDGHDEGSRHTLKDVIAEAQKLRIPIDSIGLTRSDPAFLRNLQQLAAQTGGQFRQARSDGELQSLVSTSIGAMKAQPVATFRLQTAKRDGEEHALSVQWLPGAGSAAATLPALAKASVWEQLRDGSAPRSWYTGLGALVLLLLGGGAWLALRSRKASAFASPPRVPAEAPAPPKPPIYGSPEYSDTESAIHARAGSSARGAASPQPQAASAQSQSDSGQPARPSDAIARTGMVHFLHAGPDGALGMLEVLDGPYAGRQIRMSRSPFLIGALPGNQLAIVEDPTLSGHHASLLFAEGICMVEDNNSTNGTFLNGERCTGRRTLSAGDELRMGRSVFRVTSA